MNVTEIGSEARTEVREEVGRKWNGGSHGYVADDGIAA